MPSPKAGERPLIVVKRVKKVAGGHHGGSWKVAYADFVTAMMAFFLLMWLLGAASKETREGIADYFKRPFTKSFMTNVTPGGDEVIPRPGSRGLLAPNAEKAAFQSIQRDVERTIQDDPALRALQDQLAVEVTPDGLRLRLSDSDERPMFASGSAVALPYARDLLRRMAPVLARVPNPVVLVGHTDALPYGGAAAGYTNWELSAERAGAARRELVAGGVPARRVWGVEGRADAHPIDARNPFAARNRRVEILVLGADAIEARFPHEDERAPGRAGARAGAAGRR